MVVLYFVDYHALAVFEYLLVKYFLADQLRVLVPLNEGVPEPVQELQEVVALIFDVHEGLLLLEGDVLLENHVLQADDLDLAPLYFDVRLELEDVLDLRYY